MNKVIRFSGIGICAIFLLLIRAFEDELFYDPLLEFFRMDYKTMAVPEMDNFRLGLGLLFRYSLNTIFSLAILYFAFLDKGILKLSAFLYAILFVLFFAAFFITLTFSEGTSNLLVLFYIRRFLIQPLFLLILLPAFYFQKRTSQ